MNRRWIANADLKMANVDNVKSKDFSYNALYDNMTT